MYAGLNGETTPLSRRPYPNLFPHPNIVRIEMSPLVSVWVIPSISPLGHYYPIHTQDEACKVLRALHQGETVRSDHLVYAYRYIDVNGHTLSGHDDDGEWCASEILLELLQQKDITDGIVVVSRIYGGQNLGKQRFDIIRQTAQDIIPSA